MERIEKQRKRRKLKRLRKLMCMLLILVAIICICMLFKKNDIKTSQARLVESISSKKIDGIQTVDELDISNIEVIAKDGETTVYALVKNNTETKKGNEYIKFEIECTDGKIIPIYGYVDEIEAQNSKRVVTVINKEISNIKLIRLSERDI